MNGQGRGEPIAVQICPETAAFGGSRSTPGGPHAPPPPPAPQSPDLPGGPRRRPPRRRRLRWPRPPRPAAPGRAADSRQPLTVRGLELQLAGQVHAVSMQLPAWRSQCPRRDRPDRRIASQSTKRAHGEAGAWSSPDADGEDPAGEAEADCHHRPHGLRHLTLFSERSPRPSQPADWVAQMSNSSGQISMHQVECSLTLSRPCPRSP